MAGYDLHSHTVLSDGTTTPEDNVAKAVAIGLDGLGVTDHDTTEPLHRAYAAAEGTGLDIVPGTEFSAELDGSSVHVLAYWIDPGNEPLQREMDRIRNERKRRAEQIVARLNDLGIPVSFVRVQELAGAAPIGRPHIARAVIETGAASEMQEVFDTWLRDGGPANVPKYAVDPVAAVELLVAAGGVTVLAHPGLYGKGDQGIDQATIEAMQAVGLVGIEADHPDHDPATRDRYRRIADRLGLLVTAGSDYHGERKDLELGQATTSKAVLEQLRAHRP